MRALGALGGRTPWRAGGLGLGNFLIRGGCRGDTLHCGHDDLLRKKKLNDRLRDPAL